MSDHPLREAFVALALTAAVALTGQAVTAGPAAAASPSGADRGSRQATAYALGSRGFGTRVTGGDVPVESDTTAFQRIGCTNRSGTVKRISEAVADVPGLGTVSGVSTVLRTTDRRGTVATTSLQRVASVVLADGSLGTVSIEGLRARARAFHDAAGFHATSSTEIGRIVHTPPEGDPQVLPLPTPGDPAEVPGLVSIALGQQHTQHSASGARAEATTLLVDVIPSGTRAVVGLARAKINAGVEDLLFRGGSAGLRAHSLEGILTKQRTPLTLMRCQGTRGRTWSKSLAGVDVTDALTVGALDSGQRTWRRGRVTHGWERGRVTGLDLGDGQLVVSGVVAKANLVKRPGHRARYHARGTTVGSITAGGETQTFPETGPLVIDGVASIERRVTHRTRQSLSVVGLRVTLLDGSGAVIDLGTATIGAKRSGR